jgi:hypothetical protein
MAAKARVVQTNKVLTDIRKLIFTRGGCVDVIFDHIQIRSILKGWREYELSKKKPDENILRSLAGLSQKLSSEFDLYISGKGLISVAEVHFIPKYLPQLKKTERVSKDEIET